MKKLILIAAFISIFAGITASAEDAANNYVLTIKDHIFTPNTLEIPAGQKVEIKVLNQDATPEEFESEDLDREKVIAGNSEAVILIGPLETGTYNFFGEFNEDTAKGQIIVK